MLLLHEKEHRSATACYRILNDLHVRNSVSFYLHASFPLFKNETGQYHGTGSSLLSRNLYSKHNEQR
jgi:hypothetical protein